MHKHRAALLLMIFAVGVGVSPLAAKDKPDPTKTLTGKVVDHQDHLLQDAVVYLSNTRTQAVKSYIVGPDGTYRFPALSRSTDYEVYAQYKGRKSDTKTVSQFDDRQQVASICVSIRNSSVVCGLLSASRAHTYGRGWAATTRPVVVPSFQRASGSRRAAVSASHSVLAAGKPFG
jgi:hypothetical protein